MARFIAVGGLIAAFMLTIVIIASSGGGSESSNSGSNVPGASSGPDSKDPKARKALEKGKWEVEEGDTLTSIAEQTGIDEEQLITLNPDIDPQALQPGQHLKLR